jgi:ABC-type nitrate/sulfonate/bicarbonate transport system substrate-binding protein
MATSIEQPPSAAPCAAFSVVSPLKFVAVSVRKSEHFLIARPEFKALRELKGKRLAVLTLFGSDQRAAEEILRAKGFSPTDIKPVALGEAGCGAGFAIRGCRSRGGLFAV